MRPILLLLAGALFLLLIAACGDDDDDATPTPDGSPTADASDATPTSDASDGTPAGDTTLPPSGPAGQLLLPVTPVSATLTETYHTGQDAPPSADQLPIAAGLVQALWYQSGGSYVVYYAGLFPTGDPTCPGNSISTASGFEHISNAPTAEGACEGATTLADEPAGVKVCDGKLLYLTEIPVETEGTLYGSVEAFLDDGSIVGVTSQVEADAAATPEIDLSSCSDAVS